MQRYRLIVLCGSILLMVLLAACGGVTTSASGRSQSTTSGMTMGTATAMPGINMGTATMTPGSDPMTDSLKGLSGKDFEIKFMQDMIIHHQSAIAMAKLVPTHTKRAELITLSQNIITAQTREITNMTTWLAQWYHEEPLTDSMSVPGMSTMMGDMNSLEHAKDAEFDHHFLMMMIAHHQQAVNMAHLIPSKTQRPELVQLGQNIVQTQSAEIQQMQGWQQQWFKS